MKKSTQTVIQCISEVVGPLSVEVRRELATVRLVRRCVASGCLRSPGYAALVRAGSLLDRWRRSIGVALVLL